MTERYKVDYQSPIGVIEIVGSNEAIYSILFSEEDILVNPLSEDMPQVIKDCYIQLDEYFKGEKYEFTFPMMIEGTPFQQSVWQSLTTIPYAKTASYKHIAVTMGNEKAIRAVGTANGRNKLSIVIPCHRIIGASGKLVGYAGGLWRKEWLLNHEQKFQQLK